MKPPTRHCIVKNCPNSTSESRVPGIVINFFRFPSDNKLLKKWKERCNVKDNSLLKTARVCSVHFREKDFDRWLTPGRKLLKENAVPCLKLNITDEPVPAHQESNKNSDDLENKKKYVIKPTSNELQAVVGNEQLQSENDSQFEDSIPPLNTESDGENENIEKEHLKSSSEKELIQEEFNEKEQIKLKDPNNIYPIKNEIAQQINKENEDDNETKKTVTLADETLVESICSELNNMQSGNITSTAEMVSEEKCQNEIESTQHSETISESNVKNISKTVKKNQNVKSPLTSDVSCNSGDALLPLNEDNEKENKIEDNKILQEKSRTIAENGITITKNKICNTLPLKMEISPEEETSSETKPVQENDEPKMVLPNKIIRVTPSLKESDAKLRRSSPVTDIPIKKQKINENQIERKHDCFSPEDKTNKGIPIKSSAESEKSSLNQMKINTSKVKVVRKPNEEITTKSVPSQNKYNQQNNILAKALLIKPENNGTLKSSAKVTSHKPLVTTNSPKPVHKTEPDTEVISKTKYDALLRKHEALMQEKRNAEMFSSQIIETMKRTLEQKQEEIKIMQANQEEFLHNLKRTEIVLTKILTPNQKKLLFEGKEDISWTNKEMLMAFAIRFLSRKCYHFLRQKLNYPLPGISTVQNWLSSISQEQCLRLIRTVENCVQETEDFIDDACFDEVLSMKAPDLFQKNEIKNVKNELKRAFCSTSEIEENQIHYQNSENNQKMASNSPEHENQDEGINVTTSNDCNVEQRNRVFSGTNEEYLKLVQDVTSDETDIDYPPSNVILVGQMTDNNVSQTPVKNDFGSNQSNQHYYITFAQGSKENMNEQTTDKHIYQSDQFLKGIIGQPCDGRRAIAVPNYQISETNPEGNSSFGVGSFQIPEPREHSYAISDEQSAVMY